MAEQNNFNNISIYNVGDFAKNTCGDFVKSACGDFVKNSCGDFYGRLGMGVGDGCWRCLRGFFFGVGEFVKICKNS